jgi:hypothetical protein
MDKREQSSWLLSLVLAMVALVGAAGSYHLYMNAIHAPAGESRVMSSAIILRMESKNQGLRNHYLENIEDGKMVEESKDQLKRLEYDRQGIVELKQHVLGVSE